ncbi:MAG: hypothetical protein NZT92_10525 [Abditibacteriales bacterium]|nr:hypothetical protein [Abditibacteriales bacterium]MDW8366008.1 hypothetical protein [Abditibacteriales bacterium]
MESLKFVRVVRTPSSEVYVIWDDNQRLGQVDIHYAHDVIHATLVLEQDLSLDEQEDLVHQIDQDIVSSYLPNFDREDFIVTVFRGTELESFSDGGTDLEEELELDDEDF